MSNYPPFSYQPQMNNPYQNYGQPMQNPYMAQMNQQQFQPQVQPQMQAQQQQIGLNCRVVDDFSMITANDVPIDVSAYDATLIMEKGVLPIDETSLIWFESEVGYTDTSMTHADPHTADYKVLAVKPSLNFTKYILGRIVK